MGALFAQPAMAARPHSHDQSHDRAGKDDDVTTKQDLSALFLCAIVILIASLQRPAESRADDRNAGQDARQDARQSWQAVAPGVVEPRSGQIKIAAPVIGRVGEVMVKINDKVVADEPLVRLDDEDAQARVASAQAQVAMREKARNEKSAGKAASRRDAEDAVADAEAALVDARSTFDKAVRARRSGSGSDATVTAARTAWTRAQDNLDRERAQLRKVEAQSGTPLPTQLEGQLNVARTELRVAIAELEKLTVRAPAAGTILKVDVKAGEVAGPSSPQPLLLLGDLSQLRVRAELDEHNVGKIKVGDAVKVRTDAFRGQTFAGKVAAIAPLVQPARLNSPGSRNVTDFSINEVVVDLNESGPLIAGMNVDVYFGSK
jgi:HlyD family secretion protein